MKRYPLKKSQSKRKFAKTSYVHPKNAGTDIYRGGIRL